MDPGCVVLLDGLPAELAAHVAGFLAVADARALACTRRDASSVASEVLDGERRALCRLTEAAPWGPDVADLLRRVGAGRLCHAWALPGHRPHAELCAHLARRLDGLRVGRAAAPVDVPFGVATCDVPGAVTLVIGEDGMGKSMLLRVAAAIAWEATGRRASVLRVAGSAWDDGLWEAAGTAPGSLWSDDETHSERLTLVDDTHWCADWVMTRLVERASSPAPRTDVGGTVVSTGPVPSHAIRQLRRTARVVAASRHIGHYDVSDLCVHLEPPPDGRELREMRRQLASLADFEWLVIDGWCRRWQRWTPPSR